MSMPRPTGVAEKDKEVMETAVSDAAQAAGGAASTTIPLSLLSSSALSQYNVEEEVCEIWLDHPGAGVQALLDELILRRNLRRQQLEQEWQCRRVGLAASNDTGDGDDSSLSTALPAFPAAPTKKRVQQAKELIPYRRNYIPSNETDTSINNNNNIDAAFDKQDFVQESLERRNKCKALKQWDEVNRITAGLEAMGIEINDRYKTWRVVAQASFLPKKEEISLLPPAGEQGGGGGSSTDATTTATSAGITCEMCGRPFASRNLIFKHLRDVTSGCGTSIWAEGQSVVEPPSVDKKLERQERLRQERLERNQRRSRAGIAKSKGNVADNNNNNNDALTQSLPHQQHQAVATTTAAGDDIEASLWIGDLPLPWTKPSLRVVKTKGGSSNYKRLSELLYRYNLPNTPLPWIKSVVRKAYHSKKNTPRPGLPTTAPAANQHNPQLQQQQQHDQQNGHISLDQQGDDGRHDQNRPYLGYAIVVYRSADEAAAARQHLDGLTVSTTDIASIATDKNKKDSSEDHLLPSFTLVVRPARKSGASSSSSYTNNDSSSSADDKGDSTNSRYQALLHPPGLDPPLADQLQPLADDELRLRVLALKSKRRLYQSAGQSAADKDSNHHHHHCIVNEEGPESTGVNDSAMLKNMKHGKLVAMAVAEYQLLARAGHEARPVRHYQGRLIPVPIRDSLLNLLENLLWPAQHQRPMLTSERYLVLVTSTSATPHYKELREACQELMQWADPEYYYSGIAVTKNFIASPHIDERDRSFQYAVSLGYFKNDAASEDDDDDDDDDIGGELCVEGKSKSPPPPRNGVDDHDESSKSDQNDTFINVVNTHNRIARVDGRCVHWVRTWTGGDRYSLIFYDTTDRNITPVIKGGVDVDYLL